MSQVNNASDSSDSSSSDSESDSDQQIEPKQNKIQNNPNNKNVSSSKPTQISNNNNNNENSSNRKRKLSNINSTNNNTELLMSAPPKKRRKNNITINNPQIENEEKNNNNNNSNKKRKKKKCDKNKSKNKKKKRKKAETLKKPIDGVKIDELECIVCRELPPGKIYQCINSHLLCEICYKRICECKQCLCPECRVRMSRREPSRNKLAENYLSAHLFDCLNHERGCKDKIQFCYLSQHSKNECKYRSIECKFCILGCQWKGLAKDRSKHNKICCIKKTEPKKILKLVETLNIEKLQIQKKKEQQINKYVSICKLFELRARNIICRDIRIRNWNGNSKKTEIVNSNWFNGMHKRWQFQLKIEKVANPKNDNNNSNNNNNNNSNNTKIMLNKLYVRIQCLTAIRKRIPFEICVLKGPDFGYKLEPIQFECEMTKNKRDSKWIEFIPNNILFSDEQVKNKFFTNYNTENKINLRVIMLDKRVNELANEFGAMNDNFEEDPMHDFGTHNTNNNNSNNTNNNNNNTNNNNISYSTDSSTESSSITSFSDNSTDESDIYSDLDEDYSSSDDFY